MRQASDRLSVRRYVGYDLGESLPDLIWANLYQIIPA